MTRLTTTIAWATVGLLVGMGCKKKDGAGSKPVAEMTMKRKESAHALSLLRDRISQSLKAAGLSTAELEQASARPYGAQHCVRGVVSKLDLILCDFADEAAMQTGEKKLEQFVAGAGTGAIRRVDSKREVLAVADRMKSDPNGVRINQVLKAVVKLGHPVY